MNIDGATICFPFSSVVKDPTICFRDLLNFPQTFVFFEEVPWCYDLFLEVGRWCDDNSGRLSASLDPQSSLLRRLFKVTIKGQLVFFSQNIDKVVEKDEVD